MKNDTKPIARSSATMLTLLIAGCASSIEPQDSSLDGAGGPRIEHESQGEGITLTQVDSSDAEIWVYIDLDTGDEVDVEDPLSSSAWDIRFQRYNIVTNGGISGNGRVEGVVLVGEEFDALQTSPSDGFVPDQADGPDEDVDPDYLFAKWFSYDTTTHVLTPADHVYVVRTVEGAYFKIQIVDYYDEAGTSGYPTFVWGEVEAP